MKYKIRRYYFYKNAVFYIVFTVKIFFAGRVFFKLIF